MTVSKGYITLESSPYSERTCKRCGKKFKPLSGASKFCSEECRLGEIQCKNCGTTFARSRYTQQFCSDSCRKEYAEKNNIRKKPYTSSCLSSASNYSSYIKNSNHALIAEREEKRRKLGLTYTEMYLQGEETNK